MKKIGFVFVILCLLSVGALAQAQDFCTVSVPCDATEQRYAYIARYADTKQVIPLSMYYDDCVYATVPVSEKDRTVEAFLPAPVLFTDDNQVGYEYSVMRFAAEKGVVYGNDMGQALPLNSVTRAEATAMLLRMLGLNEQPVTQQTFTDVSPDAWYYKTVHTAYQYGLVLGDFEATFSPERAVSREEFVVMLARAMQMAGLAQDTQMRPGMLDAQQVSDWATAAYAVVGDEVPYTNREIISDEDYVSELYLYPQQAATRFDVANSICGIIRTRQIYPSKLAVQYGFDQVIPSIDGSTSTYPFTEAIYNQLFSNGWYHPNRPAKHSKSYASYERLIAGEVDMLIASVYPAQDILDLAAQKGVELELIPIAHDAMIFFTNMENPVNGLTKEQIRDIYVNNAYADWSQLGGTNTKLYPYCRNADSGSQAQMEKHFLQGEDVHPDIRKETTSDSMANVLTDVMDVPHNDPNGYGLGYSIYYYFHNMDMFYDTKTRLKLLAIDGVMPTDETIADFSYPLSNYTYVVLRKDTPQDAPARKMAEFLRTEDGQECVMLAGYGKLR